MKKFALSTVGFLGGCLLFVFVWVPQTAQAGAQWDSDWGQVDVQVDNSGTFTALYGSDNGDHGVIRMTPEGGGKYSGHWARDCGSDETGTCSSTKPQSTGVQTRCWGYISGRVSNYDTKFTGTWKSCDGKDSGTWNGNKL